MIFPLSLSFPLNFTLQKNLTKLNFNRRYTVRKVWKLSGRNSRKFLSSLDTSRFQVSILNLTRVIKLNQQERDTVEKEDISWGKVFPNHERKWTENDKMPHKMPKSYVIIGWWILHRLHFWLQLTNKCLTFSNHTLEKSCYWKTFWRSGKYRKTKPPAEFGKAYNLDSQEKKVFVVGSWLTSSRKVHFMQE